MSASTGPAAKAAMLAVFAATPALSSVTTSWDAPTKDEDFAATELIWLGDVNGDEDWSSLGALRRQETYTVQIGVYVEQWGDDPQVTEVRLWDIWDVLTGALRDDLRPPSSLLRDAGVRQFDRITFRQQSGPATPEKWGSRIDGSITFVASNV